MGKSHKNGHHLQVFYACGNSPFCWGWQKEEVFLLPPGNPGKVGVNAATSPSKLIFCRCWGASGGRVSCVRLLFRNRQCSGRHCWKLLKYSRGILLLGSYKVIYIRQKYNSRKPWCRGTQQVYEHHCSHSTNPPALSAAKGMIRWKHFNRC